VDPEGSNRGHFSIHSQPDSTEDGGSAGWAMHGNEHNRGRIRRRLTTTAARPDLAHPQDSTRSANAVIGSDGPGPATVVSVTSTTVGGSRRSVNRRHRCNGR